MSSSLFYCTNFFRDSINNLVLNLKNSVKKLL